MESAFRSIVSGAKAILILLPQDPAFDHVASATALHLTLSQENKEVEIFCPTPMIVEFNKLVGVNKIKQEVGNKNLIIGFHEDYNVQGIEKVSYDIENGRFKLIIAPKTNTTPPAKEQVLISYAGVTADLIILVGGKNDADFPLITTPDLKNAQVVHLGISDINIQGKTPSSFATAASSISESITNLLKGSSYKFNQDIATNLLMGIEEGTKQFTTPTVTADTFAAVAELMRSGGKRGNQKEAQTTQFPTGIPNFPSRIPPSWTEPKIFKGTSTS